MSDPRYPVGEFVRPSEPLTPPERKEFISVIEAAPARLREAVCGLTPAQLDTPYRPGGWTVRQVAHHIPDSHVNAYVRIKLALTENEPAVKGYEEAEWAKLPDVSATPVEVSVALLDALRPPLGDAAALSFRDGVRAHRPPPGLGDRDARFLPRAVRVALAAPRRPHHDAAPARGMDGLTADRFVELSHPIEPGMITYPGLPGPEISDFLSREGSAGKYAPGTTFSIARVTLVANTGTYVDSPFHRFAQGADIAALPLDRLANLPGVLLPLPAQGAAGGLPPPPFEGRGEGRSPRRFDADLFRTHDLRGKAVLLHSGWDARWGRPEYGAGHPFVTRAAAQHLASSGAALVGIDSLNIDDTADLERPAHTMLLEAGIPIVEHLCNLSALPASGFRFFAVPAPFTRMGSFPVRAFAILDS